MSYFREGPTTEVKVSSSCIDMRMLLRLMMKSPCHILLQLGMSDAALIWIIHNLHVLEAIVEPSKIGTISGSLPRFFCGNTFVNYRHSGMLLYPDHH